MLFQINGLLKNFSCKTQTRGPCHKSTTEPVRYFNFFWLLKSRHIGACVTLTSACFLFYFAAISLCILSWFTLLSFTMFTATTRNQFDQNSGILAACGQWVSPLALAGHLLVIPWVSSAEVFLSSSTTVSYVSNLFSRPLHLFLGEWAVLFVFLFHADRWDW